MKKGLMKKIIHKQIKSVQSIHPCKYVVQISYDIIKAHGGEIKVNTKENEGTEFTISLPA